MSYQPKERPILFSAPMVRAILEGRKTQTRRIIKPQPKVVHSIYGDASIDTERIFRQGDQRIHCPYGRPGDRLWVRETWACNDSGDYLYRADAIDDDSGEIGGYWVLEKHFPGPWRPSIHMPRAASRILLETTNNRAERVCDISEADAIAEGIECCNGWYKNYLPEGKRYFDSPIDSFRSLWELINGPESWDNFVWVITFNRITP